MNNLKSKITGLLLTIWITCSASAAPSLSYEITGISDDLLKNVEARLHIAETAYPGELSSETIQTLFTDAPDNIRKGLQPYGFFRPRIQSRLTHDNDKWIAHFIVDSGQPIRITQLKLAITGLGKDNVYLQNVLKRQPLKEGNVFKVEDYNQSKKLLFDAAEKLGYMNAELIRHDVRVNLIHYQVSITLLLDTGPRYYFGPVNFSDNPLSNSLLQRFVDFKVGDPYSTDDILVLQDNLNSSGFFKQVTVQPNFNQTTDGNVPINIQLTPKKNKQYVLGVGFGTDTGFRTSFGFHWNYLTSTGHRFNSYLRYSQVDTSLQTVYSIPGPHPAYDQYNITAGIYTSDNDTGNSFSQKLGVNYVTNYKIWSRTLALDFLNERYEIYKDNNGDQRSTMLLPSALWTRRVVDNQLFPSTASSLRFHLQAASAEVFSDTGLLLGDAKGILIRSFGDRSRLVLRGELGYYIASDFSAVPKSLRFYAGGASSIRGYGYQDIGPGRFLQVASAEYQLRVYNKWYGLVFYDIGNAFNHYNDDKDTGIGPGNYKRGIGFGIMWASPVGPLKLTLARAFDKPGNPNRIEFILGPEI